MVEQDVDQAGWAIGWDSSTDRYQEYEFVRFTTHVCVNY